MSKPIIAIVGRPNVGKSTFIIHLPEKQPLKPVQARCNEGNNGSA